MKFVGFGSERKCSKAIEKSCIYFESRVFLSTRKDLQNYRIWRVSSFSSLWYLHLRVLLAPLVSLSLYSFSLKFHRWGEGGALIRSPRRVRKNFVKLINPPFYWARESNICASEETAEGLAHLNIRRYDHQNLQHLIKVCQTSLCFHAVSFVCK